METGSEQQQRHQQQQQQELLLLQKNCNTCSSRRVGVLPFLRCAAPGCCCCSTDRQLLQKLHGFLLGLIASWHGDAAAATAAAA
jgi:hypothetical protein